MVTPAARYERPSNLEGALALLGEDAVEWTVLAGGTDLFPALSHETIWSGAQPRSTLDLTAVAELGGISERDTGYRIGALVRWSEIVSSDLPGYFDCLRQAAVEVGGVQIQNRGTLAGNVCNASPAADGVPALLALDARIELACNDGNRTLPIRDFVLGNRRTARRPGEIVSAIHVPKRSESVRSRFMKLGSRRYLVISIASVALLLERDDGRAISNAAIAIGACSEVPLRITALEERVRGLEVGLQLRECVLDHAFDELSPIDDVRATATYRRHAARILCARAFEALSEA